MSSRKSRGVPAGDSCSGWPGWLPACPWLPCCWGSSWQVRAGESASAASLRIVQIGTVSVLANGQGFTVYWFTADTATRSACTGLCNAYWPPVQGPLTAAPCLTGRLGTIKRSDGWTQATYDGHPLYTYVGDSAPGQARGGAPGMNGGPWHEITYPANPGRCLTVKPIPPPPASW